MTDRYFIHLHGNHGFVSDGTAYATAQDADAAARVILLREPWHGATIHHRGRQVGVILRQDAEAIAQKTWRAR